MGSQTPARPDFFSGDNSTGENRDATRHPKGAHSMDPKNRNEDGRGTTRRDFLRIGGMAGAAALAAGSFSGNPSEAESAGPQASEPFDFEERGILDLQAAMASGAESSRSITEKYLDRIAAVDRRGPELRAVIELNPDALDIAAALDAERAAGGLRGPMHGVPVLIKDNIDTADRMTTTGGSLALAGSVAAADAFLVRRLRESGAVLLGKTNLSEWANFRSGRSSSGWSGRGGQTRNPYALDRNPCGSSSGSAVAASANLCAAAVGTETDGSIVCPGSTNGIVGIKPTVGLVSRSGIVPIASSQDTAGPMARSVRDAAILLEVLAGPDPGDPATLGMPVRSGAGYSSFLDPGGLKGARIGVTRKRFGFHERVDALMEEAIAVMKREGAAIIDPADVPTDGQFDDSEYLVLLYEFKAGLNAYLSGLGTTVPVRTLADVIDFNDRHRDLELRYFGQNILVEAESKGPLSDKAYRKALARNRRLSREKGIDAVMGRFRLDALIAPTGGPAWPTDLVNGDHFSGGCSTAAAVAGYPHVTVPAGFVFGLPVGLSFYGSAFSESRLIRLAYAFEQATQHRRPPHFLPTAELPA
jgi:amidase